MSVFVLLATSRLVGLLYLDPNSRSWKHVAVDLATSMSVTCTSPLDIDRLTRRSQTAKLISGFDRVTDHRRNFVSKCCCDSPYPQELNRVLRARS